MLDILLSGTHEETFFEEIANAATHGFGFLCAVLCFYVLILVVTLHPKRSFYSGIGGIVFGMALLAVFSISSFYHALGIWGSVWKPAMQKLDHCVIYIVIAGTYTPIVTIILMERGKKIGLGTFVLGVEWISAIVGIGTKLFVPIHDIPPVLSYGFYLFMGWAIVLVAAPALKYCPFSVFKWCLIGGLSYSFGVAFIVFDALHFNHSIWHMFVYFGAMSHFVAVLLALTDTHDIKSLRENLSSILTEARPKQKVH
jgi:hemolysin III